MHAYSFLLLSLSSHASSPSTLLAIICAGLSLHITKCVTSINCVFYLQHPIRNGHIIIPRTPAFYCSPSIHLMVVCNYHDQCILLFTVHTHMTAIHFIANCLVWSSLRLTLMNSLLIPCNKLHIANHKLT